MGSLFCSLSHSSHRVFQARDRQSGMSRSAGRDGDLRGMRYLSELT